MPNDEQIHDRPFLVIPYSPQDTGKRPLASGLSYYNCPGILLDHSPYDPTTPLDPELPIQLSVQVLNRGALSCLVTARFYCYVPTTSWRPKVVGSASFLLPGQSGPLESPAKEFTPSLYFGDLEIPTPDHFCFFAEVTTALDQAPGTFNSAGDRHYGQQNVQVLKVTAGQRLTVPFTVSALEGGVAEVSIRQKRREGALSLPPDSMRLAHDGDDHESWKPLRIELRPLETRNIYAVIYVPDDAWPDSTADVIIEQHNLREEVRDPVGAIGVTICVTG